MLQNDVISFKGKGILIMCLDGLLWITCVDGTEQMITKGQSILVSSTGKICVLAFLESMLQIESKQSVRLRHVRAETKLTTY